MEENTTEVEATQETVETLVTGEVKEVVEPKIEDTFYPGDQEADKEKAEPSNVDEQGTQKEKTDSEETASDEVAKSDETKEEKGKDEGKPKEDDKATELNLVLPEKTLLEAVELEATKKFATEHGLNNEQAAAILHEKEMAVANFLEARMDQEKAVIEGWVNSVKSDPEIGGDNFNKNVELSKRVVGRFANSAFVELLNSSGFGNHPEVVRFLSRVGDAMGSGSLTRGSQTAGAKTIEQVFYGDKTN